MERVTIVKGKREEDYRLRSAHSPKIATAPQGNNQSCPKKAKAASNLRYLFHARRWAVNSGLHALMDAQHLTGWSFGILRVVATGVICGALALLLLPRKEKTNP